MTATAARIEAMVARNFPGLKHRSLSQDLLANLSGGIDIPVREILKGQPRRRTFLGDKLFRVVKSGYRFKYYTYGTESMGLKDAERAPYGAIQASNSRRDEVTGKLRRYTWASIYDELELGVADEAAAVSGVPWNLRVLGPREAREIVTLCIEKAKATVVLAAGSYSSGSLDLDDTLGAGSEWDNQTNGDSRTSIRSMAQRIAGASGLSVKDIDVFLTDASMNAAQNDPALRSAMQYTSPGALPNEAWLAGAWGVRSVTVADAFYKDASGNFVSMYGDIAVLRVAQDLSSDYDTESGNLDSFTEFKWMGAGSMAGPQVPFRENLNTAWYFPYQDFSQPVQVNTSAAGIIRNTAS